MHTDPMSTSGRSLRTGLALSAVLVVVVAAVLTWWLVRSDDGSAASCSDDPGLEQPLPQGDVRLTPFSRDSPWNQALPDGPVPDGADSSAATLALREGTGEGSTTPIHTWINAEAYSLPVVQADLCDPVVTFDDTSTDDDLQGREIRIPASARPAEGTDKNLLVIQPDHQTLVELWTAERISAHRWKAGSLEVVDLTGSGIGPFNGVRAYGGSAFGGLIRKWEVDPSDPNYRDGVIRHPLAIAVPGSMLEYTGGDPGYDAQGFGTSKGYVAPATEQDYNAQWTYSGPLPMGSKVVLPRSVDLASLDLPDELVPVARALQDYGGYIVDRVGDETVALYAEPTVPSGWLDSARGPSSNGEALDRIRAQLVVVPPG
jgi:hypothetical protein